MAGSDMGTLLRGSSGRMPPSGGGAGWLRVAPVSTRGRRVEATCFSCERPRRLKGAAGGILAKVLKPGASYYWIG